jgi:type I restriction enzyme S subunit
MIDGDVPVLGSNTIIGYHNEGKVMPPGVVTGRSGTLGIVQFVEVPYWPHNTALWVKDFQGNDSKFTYYYLHILNFDRYSSGASVPTLNRNNLDNLVVSIPPLPIQQRIASILSSYDNLIENNLRRTKLLEESARQLYREWFVRLRFPGYEHTKIIKGVPEGWKAGNVGCLASVKSGFAFKSKDWISDGCPVIKIKNINDGEIDITSCNCVSDDVAERAIQFLLNPGDLLIAMTGATVGKVGIMPRFESRYFLNQRVGLFKSKVLYNPIWFLYIFFRDENARAQVMNYAAGAAQPNISPTQIESIKLLIGNERIMQLYSEYCDPMFSQILTLVEQNRKLKQARDILLPKLMYGEVEI